MGCLKNSTSLNRDVPKRKFEKDFKEYSSKTAALSEEVSKKSKVGRIYIKKGLSPSNFKRIMEHEVGHAIADKAEIHKKLSSLEKKDVRKLGKYLYGKHRGKTSPQEDLREGLAWIYQKAKSGKSSEKKVIKADYKEAYKALRKAKKSLGMRVIK